MSSKPNTNSSEHNKNTRYAGLVALVALMSAVIVPSCGTDTNRGPAPTVLTVEEALAEINTNMILIEGGSFLMGGGGEGEEDGDERPIHKVELSSFYLSAYEVTVAQFRAFVNSTGYMTEADRYGGSYCFLDDEWIQMEEVNWRYDAGGKKHCKDAYNHPVIHISWNDAQAFCKWLRNRTSQDWRLPTEAEWEYAAGNGAKHTRYSWGEGAPSGKQGGNISDETKSPEGVAWTTKADGYTDGYWFTAPVGSYHPNEWGVYDMSGNVWEWCQDWYAQDYYASSPSVDPQGPDSGSHRISRGASWFYFGEFLRIANRHHVGPNIRSSEIGFRVARSL